MKSKPLPIDAPRISAERVAAFRLARHHLAKKASASSVARVAGDMGGAQAQVFSAAQLALWTRTRGLRLQDVEAALWRDRTLVKVWCMRGSLHLVPSADYAVFVRGCHRRWARSSDWLASAGISLESLDRVLDAIADVLDEPLTRNEIGERLSKSLGTPIRKKAHRGWGGPSNAEGLDVGGRLLSLHGIVFLACLRGIACFGPMRGTEATFVQPRQWISGWHDMPAEQAEAELLRRYLRAHGPATVRDFALWTFMRAADARAVWSRIEDELAAVRFDDQVGWVLQADVSALQRAQIERPSVRLLPFFDAYLLGLKDKRHIVDVAHYKRVYRPQGWLAPVVLVDGRAAGVWKYERKGTKLSIRVEPFHPLPSEIRKRVEDEVDDLGRFFGTDDLHLTIAGRTRRAAA